MASNDFKIPYELGFKTIASKTVSESDVYLFAGITGDFNRVHLNEQYMETTTIGHRIAHGLLTFSLAGAPETMALDAKFEEMDKMGVAYLSAGYEHVRFIKPVFIGDTITTSYEIVEVNEEEKKTVGHVTSVNQRGDVVLVADHILKYFKK